MPIPSDKNDKTFAPIFDSVIVITDNAMRNAYIPPYIDKETVKVIDEDAIRKFNFFTSSDKILKYRDAVKDFPILIGGSSNFHHFVIAHIVGKYSHFGVPIQIVLIDRHMDCQRYSDQTKMVHCGNWVSYCYRKKLISRIIMLGCGNEMNQSSFDHDIGKTGSFSYKPDITSNSFLETLDPDIPVYLSLDTDILNLSNDWGKGKVRLEDLLKIPLWSGLRSKHIAGASIIGHVTDNRRILDSFMKVIENPLRFAKKVSFNELINDIKTTVFPKLWASMTTKPMPFEDQFKVIRTLFNRIYPLVKI